MPTDRRGATTGTPAYMAPEMAVQGEARKQDFDIWYVERRSDGWDDPTHVAAVSSAYNDDYPAVAGTSPS